MTTMVTHLRTALLLALTSIAPGSLANTDFVPHPACLDLDLYPLSQQKHLPATLPLSNCAAAETAGPIEDQLGFITYQRPRDNAGNPLGSVGYQRMAGRNAEVAYLLQTNSGGNAVFLELLTGREQPGAAGLELLDARRYGLGDHCNNELVALWNEPDDSLRMTLRASGLTLLQALVAPRGLPPEVRRDMPTVRALFDSDALNRLESQERLCPGVIEYQLQPPHTEWELQRVSIDVSEPDDESFLEQLVELVPALSNDGAAMLLEEHLPALRAKLLSALQPPRMPPPAGDQSDPDYLTFVQSLRNSVQSRNAGALQALTAADVMLGFGGSGGHADLQQWLSTPQIAEPLWQELEKLLQLGSLRMGANTVCLPYTSCAPERIPENYTPFATLVVTQNDARLLEHPQADARVLRILDYDVLQVADPLEEPEADFVQVRLYDGETGYLPLSAVRSPLALRMEVQRRAGDWQIISLLAGD